MKLLKDFGMMNFIKYVQSLFQFYDEEIKTTLKTIQKDFKEEIKFKNNTN